VVSSAAGDLAALNALSAAGTRRQALSGRGLQNNAMARRSWLPATEHSTRYDPLKFVVLSCAITQAVHSPGKSLVQMQSQLYRERAGPAYGLANIRVILIYVLGSIVDCK